MFKQKYIYIYINVYVKLKFQTLYVRFAQCNVVFLRLKYHTSKNEVYYGDMETVFAAVWQVTLLYTDLETSAKQFHHCRLKCGTCFFIVFNIRTYMFCACMWVPCMCMNVVYACVNVRLYVCIKKLQKLCNTLWKGLYYKGLYCLSAQLLE